MNKKLVYFAHPRSHYDTELEADCIEFIWATLGGGYIGRYVGSDEIEEVEIEIFNPNQLMVDRVFKVKREQQMKQENLVDPFDFFRDFAKASDYVVMASFLDGAIGSGAGDEGLTAFKAGIPVFLLSFTDIDGHKIKVFERVKYFDEYLKNSILSRDATHDRNENGEL